MFFRNFLAPHTHIAKPRFSTTVQWICITLNSLEVLWTPLNSFDFLLNPSNSFKFLGHPLKSFAFLFNPLKPIVNCIPGLWSVFQDCELNGFPLLRSRISITTESNFYYYEVESLYYWCYADNDGYYYHYDYDYSYHNDCYDIKKTLSRTLSGIPDSRTAFVQP